MTIGKGEPWGASGALPDHGVVIRSDDDARRLVTEARRRNEPVPPLGLLGGDVCRTLGGRGDEARLRSGEAVTFPVDLGEVLLDGRLHFFVAHLVARRRFWLGRVVVAMNAAWHGDWNLGPKAHLNDGLLDFAEASLRVGELGAVRARLRHGTHVPHPRIATSRAPAATFRFERPVPVWLDGHVVGSFRDITVRVRPDALTVVV